MYYKIQCTNFSYTANLATNIGYSTIQYMIIVSGIGAGAYDKKAILRWIPDPLISDDS